MNEQQKDVYFRPTVNDPFIPAYGTVWRHFKGDLYVVTGWARSTEDSTKLLVIYRRHDVDTGEFWARPESEWTTAAFLPEGNSAGEQWVERFEFVDFAAN